VKDVEIFQELFEIGM